MRLVKYTVVAGNKMQAFVPDPQTPARANMGEWNVRQLGAGGSSNGRPKSRSTADSPFSELEAGFQHASLGFHLP